MSNTQTTYMVIDNFLSNPDETREYALAQDFSRPGNYPGLRTAPIESESVINAIAELLRPHAGEITEVLGTNYQLVTCEKKSWVHVDCHNTWAGVLYLTPDAPATGGTGFYRHRETGVEYEVPENKELADYASSQGSDYTKWELIDQVANKYNRLVLFRGNHFHSSMEYFGQCEETARLFQAFFITTEY